MENKIINKLYNDLINNYYTYYCTVYGEFIIEAIKNTIRDKNTTDLTVGQLHEHIKKNYI